MNKVINFWADDDENSVDIYFYQYFGLNEKDNFFSSWTNDKKKAQKINGNDYLIEAIFCLDKDFIESNDNAFDLIEKQLTIEF